VTPVTQEANRPVFGAASPQRSPGFLLWQVSNIWQQRIRAALEPLDLTHVQFVLLAGVLWLQRQGDGPVTQVRLARHAATDVMMTSKVVRTLEQKGLITRDTDPHDTRAKTLAVTAAGEAVLRDAIPAVEQGDADFFAVVQAQLPQLMVLLDALAHPSANEQD
jgi:DNA-binding MarR family transcriptional regulator